MSTSTVDPARAAFIAGHTDEERGLSHYRLAYTSASETYEVSGYADGSAAHCTCKGYQYSRRNPAQCKHTLAFGLLLEHVERQRHEARSNRDLLADEAWWAAHPNRTVEQQRALNCIRQVLRSRGIRTPSAIARGRAAADELFGGAA